jgi:hypothetical protein
MLLQGRIMKGIELLPPTPSSSHRTFPFPDFPSKTHRFFPFARQNIPCQSFDFCRQFALEIHFLESKLFVSPTTRNNPTPQNADASPCVTLHFLLT